MTWARSSIGRALAHPHHHRASAEARAPAGPGSARRLGRDRHDAKKRSGRRADGEPPTADRAGLVTHVRSRPSQRRFASTASTRRPTACPPPAPAASTGSPATGCREVEVRPRGTDPDRFGPMHRSRSRRRLDRRANGHAAAVVVSRPPPSDARAACELRDRPLRHPLAGDRRGRRVSPACFLAPRLPARPRPSRHDRPAGGRP
jgi:hypothetical protein